MQLFVAAPSAIASTSSGRTMEAFPAEARMSRASPSGTAARIGVPEARYSYVFPGTIVARVPCRQVLHRQEEEIRGSNQSHRLGVGDIAVEVHQTSDYSDDRAVTVGEHAGQVDLDRGCELGIGRRGGARPPAAG